MRARMQRPFRERLASVPVVLEIVPPGRRASEKAVTSFVDRLREAMLSLRTLDAINIPEVLDENHAGQPFYRDMDPRVCASLLRGDLPPDTIGKKVAAHEPSPTAHRLGNRRQPAPSGLRQLVFHGAHSSTSPY